jgi:hypothetical protein
MGYFHAFSIYLFRQSANIKLTDTDTELTSPLVLLTIPSNLPPEQSGHNTAFPKNIKMNQSVSIHKATGQFSSTRRTLFEIRSKKNIRQSLLNRLKPLILLLSTGSFTMAQTNTEEYRPAYEKALAGAWETKFTASGEEEWSSQWFIDGYKASLKPTDEGLYYASGPIAGENASHSVLWTKDTFEGDLKIEFDYTRLDTVDQYVNILYLYATGSGPAPYVEDIATWSGLRKIPYMRSYFDHMNLLHISFAAFDNSPDTGPESGYIRARRYPRSLFEGSFQKMELQPDYSAIGLFEPGILHHVTVIRRGNDLFMNVQNSEESRLFYWDLSQIPALNEGRVGLRHMWQRAALYRNFTISEAAPQTTPE